MDILRCADGPEFLARAGSFLEAAEVENVLMLGLARGDAREDAYFAAVLDAERPIACAMRTPPWKAIVSRGPSDALALLARDLHREFGSLPAVLGPEPDVEAFAASWAELTGVSVRRGVHQGVLAASVVRPPATPPAGRSRTATEDDLPLVIEWTHAFVEDVGLDSPADHEEGARRRVRQGRMWLWDDDAPVSMAGWGGETGRGARVGPVYTPPELRRRGYASACVAALTRRLLDDGFEYCALYTDLANPTSNHIYESVGYERVCEMSDYHFD